MAAAEEYRQRLAERKTRVDEHAKRHITFGNIRLLIGLAGAAMAWFAFVESSLNPLWLAAPVVAFLALAMVHERVVRARVLAQRAMRFYERGLARLEDRWAGTGEFGERFVDPTHPYADDLDLFGKASLFELLNEARTQTGEEQLADWLRTPSSESAIRQRQEAVAELRNEMDLREDIFLIGEDVRTAVDAAKVVSWAESPVVLHSKKLQGAAAAMTAFVIVSAIVAVKTGFTSPLALAFLAVTGFGVWLRPRVLKVITQVDDAVHDLELLSALLLRIESRSFESQRLRELKKSLDTSGLPPSSQIRRLHRLAELIDSRDNQLMRMVGPPLLYGTHLAFAVERWRAECGLQVRAWVSAVGEFEAILSLAGYSYEHPQDPFPVFQSEVVLDGEMLGHPLIADSKCIPNSIRLDAGQRMRVVSGSNMSGKSTYLRAIGINVVLAMAGAPVRAKSMTLCPLSVGAAIRVTDSLQGGASRFYAEITRLRKIVDLTATGSRVLFLLDELLAGTNSHDRRIGAEGILNELMRRGAIGLITTHDLALTAIADALTPKAVNVHFEDHLENGQLRFDHTLRPGVVKKSNALELMRSIGLDV